MLDTTPPRLVGTVLLVSGDAIASRQLTDALQQLALSVEVCVDVPAATDRLSRRKFEAVVIDLGLGDQATVCLEHVRASASNRTAVIFTLTGSSQETARALKQGFSFVLQRPLTPETISHTLKVAYGLIVRERRRYFRYPVSVPVVLSRKAAPEVFGRTVNISERGMALSTLTLLAPGSEATAQFTLPSSHLLITAESRVCWNNEKGEAGLSFLFLPFDGASELQGWLAQKLEEQLPQPVTEKFRQDSRS
jgi:CheY-like chemotaxis protein